MSSTVNTSPSPIKKQTGLEDFIDLNKVQKEKQYVIVHDLQKFTLIQEEVKYEQKGKSLDKYFFRNFGLYCKEVWISFLYAFQLCIKTYTNFKNFKPNVRRKWIAFKRFWSENWKPLVFISRLGEFWVDFVKWTRTPRRADGTGRRRFFTFYMIAALCGFIYLIMYLSLPEGGLDETGIYFSYTFADYYGFWGHLPWILSIFLFLTIAFGLSNILKRYLNTYKRYPLVMTILVGIVLIAVDLGLYNIVYAKGNEWIAKVGGPISFSLLSFGFVILYILMFMDGTTNCISNVFFVKGVDGSNTLKRNVMAWLYLVPALLPLLVFTLLPMINALLMSFVKFDQNFTYTGWSFFEFMRKVITNEDNFIQTYLSVDWFVLTFKDPAFLHSLITTTIIAVVTVPISTFIAVFIAVFLNSIKKFQAVLQTVYFLPYVTSMTAITAVWRLMLQDGGTINTIFGLNLKWLTAVDPLFRIGSRQFIGFSGGQAIYEYSRWAYPVYPQLIAYIIYSIWNGLAFKIVIFLSGLQSIDKQIYQAAELDGASASKKFIKITVPLLGPILLFNTLTSLIGAFKVYTATKTLFIDNPMFKTIVYYMFDFINPGTSQNYGRGSAVAFTLFFILLIFTLIRMFISKKTNIRMSKEDKRLAKQRAKTMAKKSRADRILGGGVQ